MTPAEKWLNLVISAVLAIAAFALWRLERNRSGAELARNKAKLAETATNEFSRLTSGVSNVSIGERALEAMPSGTNNTAIGPIIMRDGVAKWLKRFRDDPALRARSHDLWWLLFYAELEIDKLKTEARVWQELAHQRACERDELLAR